MSSAPNVSPRTEQDEKLSVEEWWKLFDEVRLRMAPAYEKLGGAVAFFRRERDGENHL